MGWPTLTGLLLENFDLDISPADRAPLPSMHLQCDEAFGRVIRFVRVDEISTRHAIDPGLKTSAPGPYDERVPSMVIKGPASIGVLFVIQSVEPASPC